MRSRPPFTGVLLGPGPESAFRSAFWAILGTCLGVPQRVLFECFLAFFGPKNTKKHSKSTLWGTPRQVPKIAQKALRKALSGPGPKSTPVNGGQDRKPLAQDFLFLARRIFSRILSPDFLSSFLWGKSAQKNPPGKSPAKSSKIYTTKIPDTFLQRGRAKKSSLKCCRDQSDGGSVKAFPGIRGASCRGATREGHSGLE